MSRNEALRRLVRIVKLRKHTMVEREPYWVQIEVNPNGTATGYQNVNLADVKFVTVDREHPQEPLTIQFVLGNPSYVQNKLVGKPAESFLKYWESYNQIPEDRKDPAAQPKSDIRVVRDVPSIPQYRP